jgi:hypothetical protein
MTRKNEHSITYKSGLPAGKCSQLKLNEFGFVMNKTLSLAASKKKKFRLPLDEMKSVQVFSLILEADDQSRKADLH